MHHFFVSPDAVGENTIEITGSDVNHIKNVLRMKVNEEILVSDGTGTDYTCQILALSDDNITVKINDFSREARELPADIYLFQGLPKSDKMELIIQKAVELGAKAIIPVITKRTIVKLDKKKENSKLVRWQNISESAAKQSKRSVIPEIMEFMSYKEAIEYVSSFDVKMIPYENARGMEATRELVSSIKEGDKVAIFIGPEGGFCESEIELANEAGVVPVSLGNRILRTETAGLCTLSILMFYLDN